MKIAVLGAGGWGTTLAILLSKNGHKVTLWEYNLEYANTLKEYRENFYFLPKIKIPANIKITNDIEQSATGKDVILCVTPTQYIRDAFQPIANLDLRETIIVSASKGIEKNSLYRVSEIFKDVLKKLNKKKIASLSGPSHAEEVSKRIPTAVVVAATEKQTTKQLQEVFSNNYFRVYTSSDLAGVETGGALKNVIAIAAGIADGAQFGDNTKAAIMTRGISEIMRLGIKYGAKVETFFGLSGIGDLIVTCGSKHSRNRYVGEEIGKGKKLKTVLKEMKMVAEGVATTESAYQLSKQFNIELPITEQVYEILFREKNPHHATTELMTRKLIEEYRLH